MKEQAGPCELERITAVAKQHRSRSDRVLYSQVKKNLLGISLRKRVTGSAEFL